MIPHENQYSCQRLLAAMLTAASAKCLSAGVLWGRANAASFYELRIRSDLLFRWRLHVE